MLPRLRTRNVAARGCQPAALAASSRHAPKSLSSRRGIATIWVLAAMPVLLTLLVMLVDAGNLWVARTELKNALDAGALSGVKTWGEGGSTLQARLDAQDAFNTNTILGTQYSLSTVVGGCTNGNSPPPATAEILLGTISDAASGFTFDCSGTPGCIVGAFSVTFAVDTSAVCPTDPTTADTFTRFSAFRIESFTGPVGSTLNSVTLNVGGMQIRRANNTVVADEGHFDFRPPPPVADINSGFFPPTVYYFGAPPATNGSTTLSGCGLFPFTTGLTSATHGATSGTTPTSFTWSFAGFDSGDVFVFGADTDCVGPQGATGDGPCNGTAVQDFGGDFGTDLGAALPKTETGATVTVNISGSSVSGTLVRVSADRSEVTLAGVLTGGNAFGVRTRKSVSVPSVASSFLGLSVNPYQVTCQSYARFACVTGPPQLVHINSFVCACP